MGFRGSSLSPRFLPRGKASKKAFWALMAAAGRVLGLGPKPQAAQMCRLPGSSAKLIPMKPQMQLCPCFPSFQSLAGLAVVQGVSIPALGSLRGEVGRAKRLLRSVPSCLRIPPWACHRAASTLEEQAEMEQGSPGTAAHTGFLFPTWSFQGRGYRP